MLRFFFLLTAFAAVSWPLQAADTTPSGTASKVVVTELMEFAGCKTFLAALVDVKETHYAEIASDIARKAEAKNALTIFYPSGATYLDGSALAVVSEKEGAGIAVWLQDGKQPLWGNEDAACIYFSSELIDEAKRDPQTAPQRFINQNVSVIGVVQNPVTTNKDSEKQIAISSDEGLTHVTAIFEDPKDPVAEKLKKDTAVVARCLTRDSDGKDVTLHHCIFFPL